MGTRQIDVKLQNARDVELNWNRNDPILLDGEIAVVFDATNDPDQARMKIGVGQSKFSELPYWEDQTKVPITSAGIANGVATLDEDGLIPLSQLPKSLGGEGEPTKYIPKKPEQLGILIYNGNPQMPVWRYYDTEAFIIGGQITATDAGEYITTFQPADGYEWEEGGRAPVFCTWEIQKKCIETSPSLPVSEFTYNGSSQSPQFEYDNDGVVVGGVTSATDAGTYQAIFLPDTNYTWADGSADLIEIEWTIAKQVLTALPQPTAVLVYTGSPQLPIWKNNPEGAYTITESAATDVGEYSSTFVLTKNFCWSQAILDSLT